MTVKVVHIVNINGSTYALNPLQSKILKLLKDKGPLNRRELVKELKTPRSTIRYNITQLERQKLVTYYDMPEAARGRRFRYWQLEELGKEVYNICKI